MKNVEIYTDGACSGNPGIGGWGAVLFYKNTKKEISGYCESTTNNRMELTAVISALSQLKEKCNVSIYSDSAYVINAFVKGWTNNWQLTGWKGTNNKGVLNKDLWLELIFHVAKHSVTWNKVKGHSDNEYNNLCDKLATDEIKKFKEKNGG